MCPQPQCGQAAKRSLLGCEPKISTCRTLDMLCHFGIHYSLPLPSQGALPQYLIGHALFHDAFISETKQIELKLFCAAGWRNTCGPNLRIINVQSGHLRQLRHKHCSVACHHFQCPFIRPVEDYCLALRIQLIQQLYHSHNLVFYNHWGAKHRLDLIV